MSRTYRRSLLALATALCVAGTPILAQASAAAPAPATAAKAATRRPSGSASLMRPKSLQNRANFRRTARAERTVSPQLKRATALRVKRMAHDKRVRSLQSSTLQKKTLWITAALAGVAVAAPSAMGLVIPGMIAGIAIVAVGLGVYKLVQMTTRIALSWHRFRHDHYNREYNAFQARR